MADENNKTIDQKGPADKAGDSADQKLAEGVQSSPSSSATATLAAQEHARDEALAAHEDDGDLEGQLDDLRGELSSQLPGPERFLTFDQALAGKRDDFDEDDPTAPGRFPNSPRFLLRYGLIALIVAAVLIAAVMLFARVDVPYTVGRSSIEASEAIAAAGLNFEIFEVEDDQVAPGIVISTTPAAGESALRGTTVVIRVSQDAGQVAVPSLGGMSLDEAQSALTAARLSPQVIHTFDNTVPKDYVVGFLPVAGTPVPAGSTVTVLITAGVLDTPLDVPRVIGLSEDAARGVLRGAGFNPVFFYGSSTRGEVDQVIAQTPGEGNTVAPGSPVLVMVSTGNSTAGLPLPNLDGQTENAAKTAVQSAGFEPEAFSMVDLSVAPGTVISQMPPAQDAFMRAGEKMGFIVSRGELSQSEVPSVLGLDRDAALDALREAGFNPLLVTDPRLPLADEASPALGGQIITQQFPAGGSNYYVGLTVLIFLTTQEAQDAHDTQE